MTDDGEKDDKSRSSLPMTSFNMVNSIVGSGVIGKSHWDQFIATLSVIGDSTSTLGQW